MIGPHVTDMISEAALAQVLNATPWKWVTPFTRTQLYQKVLEKLPLLWMAMQFTVNTALKEEQK